MRSDSRLTQWLELADELEAFDHFMHSVWKTRSDQRVDYDAGKGAAQRMRLIASSPWLWYGWKRGKLEGIVEAKLRTFRRWISESGGDSWAGATEEGREMQRRMLSIERNLERLG